MWTNHLFACFECNIFPVELISSGSYWSNGISQDNNIEWKLILFFWKKRIALCAHSYKESHNAYDMNTYLYRLKLVTFPIIFFSIFPCICLCLALKVLHFINTSDWWWCFFSVWRSWLINWLICQTLVWSYQIMNNHIEFFPTQYIFVLKVNLNYGNFLRSTSSLVQL